MNKPSLFSESNRATYEPESNKIRLYIGRVPRDEYEALRAEGWTSTPKQDCDFVAVWTPSRYATAESYAGIVEDEDMDPAERAADRAERFTGYLEKRTGEALDRADSYESRDQFHGYQSEAKANREARRHDRIGTKAVDAWGKAEYWQRRTQGVIAHALYISSPSVRMGRIKTLEAEQRKHAASHLQWVNTWNEWKRLSELPDSPEKDEAVRNYAGSTLHSYDFQHPRPKTVKNSHVLSSGSSLYTLMGMVESGYGSSDVTGAEACALFFAKYPNEPKGRDAWTAHYELRLAYERQMIEAAGGRAGELEIEVGGKFMGKLIWKVNKSPVTKRVTSVSVIGPKVEGWTYKASNITGTEYAEYQFDTERASPDAYAPPTEETTAEIARIKKLIKTNKPAKDACPLINPTVEEAKRLMAQWNVAAALKHAEAVKAHKTYGEFKPGVIGHATQAAYSELSKGTYASCGTQGLKADGTLMSKREGDKGAVCKLRIKDRSDWWTPATIIVISDKPQKPLPASVWTSELVTA